MLDNAVLAVPFVFVSNASVLFAVDLYMESPEGIQYFRNVLLSVTLMHKILAHWISFREEHKNNSFLSGNTSFWFRKFYAKIFEKSSVQKILQFLWMEFWLSYGVCNLTDILNHLFFIILGYIFCFWSYMHKRMEIKLSECDSRSIKLLCSNQHVVYLLIRLICLMWVEQLSNCIKMNCMKFWIYSSNLAFWTFILMPKICNLNSIF